MDNELMLQMLLKYIMRLKSIYEGYCFLKFDRNRRNEDNGVPLLV